MLTGVPAMMLACVAAGVVVPPTAGSRLTASVKTCAKLAVIVAFELKVTVVDALFASPNVAVPLVTVQLTNMRPVLGVALILTAVPAAMLAWLDAGVVVPPPVVGLRLTVSVYVVGPTAIVSKTARIVAFPLNETVVDALLALANVAAVAGVLVTSQRTNLLPAAAVADMLNGVPALTVCAPDGVTVPPVVALTVSVCVRTKLAVIVLLADMLTVVDALLALVTPAPVQLANLKPVAGVATMSTVALLSWVVGAV
jgi:hypothetical protein